MKQKEPSLFTLIALVSFAAVGAVCYTPGLPQIEKAFGVLETTAKWTVSIYMIAYLFSNLIFGPIENRWGRKKGIYIGMAVTLLGIVLSLIAGYAGLFWLLMVGRFVTGLGAGSGFTIAFTIVADVYAPAALRKKVAYIALAFAVMPFVSVMIGGVLVHFFGWISTFYFLLLWGIVTTYLGFRLPETAPALDREALSLVLIWRSYRRAFGHPLLVMYALIAGLSAALFYIFATQGPFIGIGIIGLSPAVYGLLNLIPGAGYFVGNLISSAISGKVDARKSMVLGIWILLAMELVFFFLFLFGWVNWVSLFIPVAVAYVGNAFNYANGAALASRQIEDKASAAAVLCFLIVLSAFVGSVVVGSFSASDYISLPSVYLGCLFCLFLLFLGTGAVEKKRATRS